MAKTEQTVSSLYDFKGSLWPTDTITAHPRDNSSHDRHELLDMSEAVCACEDQSVSTLG